MRRLLGAGQGTDQGIPRARAALRSATLLDVYDTNTTATADRFTTLPEDATLARPSSSRRVSKAELPDQLLRYFASSLAAVPSRALMHRTCILLTQTLTRTHSFTQ